ncbi:hypothetical protein TCAL_04731 [Tigriopus californicus]|uniref:Activin types I and II receptor domain-containing protein n=1 Tax=Tigriopus californicus TaxID=6832 RepID=A0A553PRY3_TIGCA|nr:uncharacterized protein LOC131891711 [Tigriopus californicus]XP_059097325.1 uncharacterized protein LOC131891711 [Tigriopus californicus]TRY80439.1 hypothetical protein TCAL_04731 [Tigriopus californicus]|eukprot:TCALIF_04731-PA protein Name:"Protein of unknown function" AED:0.15 eAED:0.15 QI:69/1/1/1/0/0/3/194/119
MEKQLAILLIFSTCFVMALGEFKCYDKSESEKDEMGTVKTCSSDVKSCKKTIIVMDEKTTYSKACGTSKDQTDECAEDNSNEAKKVTTCYCKTSECNPASRKMVATLTIFTVMALNLFL